MELIVPHEITWPSRRERRHLRCLIPGLPECVSFVDATETYWRKSHDHCYSGKKHSHTLSHQTVVRNDGRILHSFAGEAGATNDVALYKRSEPFLYRNNFFSDDEYIIGDGGYQGLIEAGVRTPISSPTDAQMKLNAFIAFHRAVVEQVFQRILQWWPYCGNFPKGEADKATKAFLIACAFTNMLFEGKDQYVRGENYLRGELSDWEIRDMDEAELGAFELFWMGGEVFRSVWECFESEITA